MGTKETNTTTENPFFMYNEAAANTFKEVWGWQMKTAQNMFDQGLKAAQTWGEFTQNQVQETARFSQEFMKMNMAQTEEMRKSFTNLNEKVFSSNR
ncbi:MAG: hypothetical protein ACLGGX_05610 [Bdellovibrionia bacterium]